LVKANIICSCVFCFTALVRDAMMNSAAVSDSGSVSETENWSTEAAPPSTPYVARSRAFTPMSPDGDDDDDGKNTMNLLYK